MLVGGWEGLGGDMGEGRIVGSGVGKWVIYWWVDWSVMDKLGGGGSIGGVCELK